MKYCKYMQPTNINAAKRKVDEWYKKHSKFIVKSLINQTVEKKVGLNLNYYHMLIV